jgi:hypothetical protein
MSLSVEKKYKLYEKAVQCHEADIDFIRDEFKKEFGRDAKILREDFGGTAAMAVDWVAQGKDYYAYGVNLDQEPQQYGLAHHYTRLDEDGKKRMQYVHGNVLDDFGFKSDITVAFNFSYFIFKNRPTLLNYFKKAYEGIKEDGAFFLDIFGGEDCRQELVEETDRGKFTYYWDCDSYNPITSEVLYYIHFKTHKDGKMHKRVFTYDWRMWDLREIIDILEEAGFSQVHAYWEGDDDDGGGDGEFTRVTKAENCESWVTYLMAIK